MAITLGRPPSMVKTSDDGRPSGSAGTVSPVRRLRWLGGQGRHPAHGIRLIAAPGPVGAPLPFRGFRNPWGGRTSAEHSLGIHGPTGVLTRIG